VKSSGLPCRATPDCEFVFAVAHQDSMQALRDAAARRDAHELEAHGYKHIATATAQATPFAQSTPSPRRRGRRNEELNTV